MKVVLRVVLGLVVLVVVVGILAVVFLDSLAKKAIEEGGTQACGVPTRLESASLGLASGRFALAGLVIENPPGFAEPAFFSMRSTELELPLSMLLADPITIPAFSLEGITIDLERNSSGTNYGVILKNLERFQGPAKPEGEQGPAKPATEGGKKFLLKRLVLRDTRATVNLLPAGGELTKLSLSIPEIVVEELGSEMTLGEICALVVKTVVGAAIQVGSGVLPADVLADLKGRLGDLEGTARETVGKELGKVESKLEEQAQKLGPEAEKALKEASDKLGGKLDGLLKKKKE